MYDVVALPSPSATVGGEVPSRWSGRNHHVSGRVSAGGHWENVRSKVPTGVPGLFFLPPFSKTTRTGGSAR